MRATPCSERKEGAWLGISYKMQILPPTNIQRSKESLFASSRSILGLEHVVPIQWSLGRIGPLCTNLPIMQDLQPSVGCTTWGATPPSRAPSFDNCAVLL